MKTMISRRRFFFIATILHRLVRLPNLLIILFTQFFVRIFLAGPVEDWQEIITDTEMYLLSLSTIYIAAAGYVINDYYDIKIDSINRPKRIVVGRFLSRRQTILIHTILNVAGIITGYLVSWEIAAINFSSAFLLWAYSNYFKRIALIGNLLVSALTGLSVYIIAVYTERSHFLILSYAVFAFFISLIREIIKDIEDVKGDASFGCRTLPVIYGIRKAKNVIYILLLSFTLVLISLGYLLKVDPWFFIAGVFTPTVYLAIILMKADTRKEFSFLSLLCKIIMIGGVLSMIFI